MFTNGYHRTNSSYINKPSKQKDKKEKDKAKVEAKEAKIDVPVASSGVGFGLDTIRRVDQVQCGSPAASLHSVALENSRASSSSSSSGTLVSPSSSVFPAEARKASFIIDETYGQMMPLLSGAWTIKQYYNKAKEAIEQLDSPYLQMLLGSTELYALKRSYLNKLCCKSLDSLRIEARYALYHCFYDVTGWFEEKCRREERLKLYEQHVVKPTVSKRLASLVTRQQFVDEKEAEAKQNNVKSEFIGLDIAKLMHESCLKIYREKGIKEFADEMEECRGKFNNLTDHRITRNHSKQAIILNHNQIEEMKAQVESCLASPFNKLMKQAEANLKEAVDALFSSSILELQRTEINDRFKQPLLQAYRQNLTKYRDELLAGFSAYFKKDNNLTQFRNILKKVIEHYDEKGKKYEKGRLALKEALTKRQAECLLEYKVTASNSQVRTFIAPEDRQIIINDVVESKISYADFDGIADENDNTLMHHAIAKFYQATPKEQKLLLLIIELLAQHGNSIFSLNKDKLNSLDYARQQKLKASKPKAEEKEEVVQDEKARERSKDEPIKEFPRLKEIIAVTQKHMFTLSMAERAIRRKLLSHFQERESLFYVVAKTFRKLFDDKVENTELLLDCEAAEISKALYKAVHILCDEFVTLKIRERHRLACNAKEKNPRVIQFLTKLVGVADKVEKDKLVHFSKPWVKIQEEEYEKEKNWFLARYDEQTQMRMTAEKRVEDAEKKIEIAEKKAADSDEIITKLRHQNQEMQIAKEKANEEEQLRAEEAAAEIARLRQALEKEKADKALMEQTISSLIAQPVAERKATPSLPIASTVAASQTSIAHRGKEVTIAEGSCVTSSSSHHPGFFGSSPRESAAVVVLRSVQPQLAPAKKADRLRRNSFSHGTSG